MNYAFVSRYNPAYDQFLTRYFNEGGIEFDQETTFEEVRPRWILAESMKDPSPQERLFRTYISNWRMHPEARPCYYWLFDQAIGGTGQPNFVKLEELESELKDVRMKLLFSSQEAAQSISDYFRRYLRDPLSRELEQGHGGKEILKYFTSDELRAHQFARVDIEGAEATWNAAGGKLVLWFDSITPPMVELEIHRVLAEHESNTDHINSPNPKWRPEDRNWSCSHEYALVKLSTYREPNHTKASVWLSPSRGRDAAERAIGLDWDIVAFPEYLVVGTK